LAKRVGEQKLTVSNIVTLLSKNTDEEVKSLIKEFNELESIFEKVELSYQYSRPETDPVKKQTIIKSTTQVNVSDEVLEEILVKITSIRTLITG